MPDYVRVKAKDTGHEFSMIASAVNEDAVQVLKKDAVDPAGNPLPPEFKQETGQKAATKKESS